MRKLSLSFDPKTRLIGAAKKPPTATACPDCGEVLAGNAFGIGLAVRSGADDGEAETCPICERARRAAAGKTLTA